MWPVLKTFHSGFIEPSGAITIWKGDSYQTHHIIHYSHRYNAREKKKLELILLIFFPPPFFSGLVRV